MRLFGVTIAPAPAPHSDPPDRDPSPNPPVAVREDVMRKCKSMGNLAALASASGDAGGAGDGYLSDGGLLQSSGKRRRAQDRKKAVPWTEEEHRTFLAGLEKLGKGDWRGIAKNFVTTRTPTQVASHAQKYFLRQTNPNKKKRRSSLFDMMASNLSPAPNCPILPPTMAKYHEMVAMTKQLQNSSLEGISSSNAAPQVSRDLPPPVPSFKATTVDTSFSKMNHMVMRMGCFSQIPVLFRQIPIVAEGTPPIAPPSANITAPTFQANPTSCTSVFLTPQTEHPAEKNDLELTVGPPSQQKITNISSQKAVGVIQVV